jgi:hypothetical protein
MRIALITTRSVAVATVCGIIVAASFVALAGELWELGLPAGLAAAALVLVTPLQIRDGRFFSQRGRQVRIVQTLAIQVVSLLGYVAATAIGLDRSTGLLLGGLIIVAGSAVYSLGFVGGALHQIEDDDEAADRAALSLRR